MSINWTTGLKDKKQVLTVDFTCINQILTMGDYNLLILIGQWLVQFKLGDVSRSYKLRLGLMVRLHTPNLIQVKAFINSL